MNLECKSRYFRKVYCRLFFPEQIFKFAKTKKRTVKTSVAIISPNIYAIDMQYVEVINLTLLKRRRR